MKYITKRFKHLTVKKLARIFWDFDDSIEPTYSTGDTSGNPDSLDFYFKCTDYTYIWAGIFRNQKKLEKWLDSTDDWLTCYVNYCPAKNKVWFEIEANDKGWHILNVFGAGKKRLIQEMQDYCNTKTGMSCEQYLADLNS